MPNFEQPRFEPKEPAKNKHGGGLTKKILRAGVLAATLAAGHETGVAQEIKPLSAQAEKNPAKFFVLYNPSALEVMLKTGIIFKGSDFLYLTHVKKGIDLSENGTAIGVEVIAQGERGLLVKIHKKSETPSEPDKITEIKILNGFIQPNPDVAPKK